MTVVRTEATESLLLTARRALVDAQAGRAALESAHAEVLVDAMAAEVAAVLVAGEPCRACGSTVHPRPAAGGSAGEVEASRRALVAAERLVAACAGVLALVESGPAESVRTGRTPPDGSTTAARTLH